MTEHGPTAEELTTLTAFAPEVSAGSARWPGRPRPISLLAEALAGARAQPVITITTALVIAIVCLVVLATTGQSAASEQAVVAHIDSLGSRLVVAFDQSGDAHIAPTSVQDVAALDQVSWAFAVGPVVDVTNADSPREDVVAARTLFGHTPAALPLTLGRAPGPGEAIIGADAARTLGLRDGVGVVTDGTRSWPVVGVFHADGPLDGLNATVLVAAGTAEVGAGAQPADARYVYAMARDVGAVGLVSRALPAVLRSQQPAAITIDEPSGVVELREAVAGELGRSSRLLMALVLAVGLSIITITVTGAVAGRRRDFGRRRALGASRTAIVVLVLLQTATAGLAGAIVGTGAGLVVVHTLAGRQPGAGFVCGVAALAFLIALVGSLAPAILAANRDPVQILRVP